MDINVAEKVLKDEYDCIFIEKFSHGKYEFVKAIENHSNPITYRYFNVTNNQVKEVTDELLLAYFKQKYELHLDVNF